MLRPRLRKSSRASASLNRSRSLCQSSSTHLVVSGITGANRSDGLSAFAVIFFRTRPPIEPVSFVRTICEDIRKGARKLHFHSVKRLTPMTLIGKANEHGLHDIAQRVLAPHFHQDGSSEKKVRMYHSVPPLPVMQITHPCFMAVLSSEVK